MRPILRGLVGLAVIVSSMCGCLGDPIVIVIAPHSDLAIEDEEVSGADSDPSALTIFDDDLAGYGTWWDDDTYGTVWTPTDAAFVPYATNGTFADLGGDLIWLSEVPWGPATLHHGRWVPCRGRWCWIPGRRYSAAWVTWTHDGDRTSWAPAAPTVVWRQGVPVRITPPVQPIVGTRIDSELALVPPAMPPQELARHAAARCAGRWGSSDDGWQPHGSSGASMARSSGGGMASLGSFGSPSHFGSSMTSYSHAGSAGGHAGVAMGGHR